MIDRYRIAVATVVIAVLLAAGFLVNFYLNREAVLRAEHAWCTIIHLSLAGQKPASLPPKQLQAYHAITGLARDYGCLP